MLAAGLAAPHAIAAEDAAKTLHGLFDAGWERSLRENPFFATYLGDPRYDDQLPDVSPAAIDASNEADRRMLADVEAIPAASLTPEDQLNRELFRRMYADAIAGYEWGTQYLPLNHMDGIQNLDQITQLLPFATVKDYENWLARLGKFSNLMDQNIALMRDRHREEDGPAARDHGARAAADRHAAGRRSHSEPVLRSVQDHARLDPGRRADTAARAAASQAISTVSCRPTGASTSSSARSTCRLPATPWVSAICRAARRGISDASAGSRPPT